jgi:hypothetical protein
VEFVDESFLDENEVRIDDVHVGHGVGATDNEAWKTKRKEWAVAMWTNIDNTRI